MRYVCTAQVVMTNGAWTSSRQVPAFYVDALNESNAVDIGRDILTTMIPRDAVTVPDVRLHVLPIEQTGWE